MVAVLLYHLGAYFSRVLPFRLPEGIAWVIGQVSYWCRPGTRRVVRQNLRIIHGDTLSGSELRSRTRAVIMNFARCIQLFLALPFLDAEWIDRSCDFSELEEATRDLDGGAFILASGHIGPWELGGLCLSHYGYKVHTVALEHPSERVTRFYSERRDLVGIKAYPLSGSFQHLKKALEVGEVVALLIDRAYSKVRREFTLFGVPREFPLGHLVLAARCQVPVLTGAIVFDGRDRYKYVHGGTHFPDDSLDEFEKLERLQGLCLRALEGIIARYSDQWFHFKTIEGTEQ